MIIRRIVREGIRELDIPFVDLFLVPARDRKREKGAINSRLIKFPIFAIDLMLVQQLQYIKNGRLSSRNNLLKPPDENELLCSCNPLRRL